MSERQKNRPQNRSFEKAQEKAPAQTNPKQSTFGQDVVQGGLNVLEPAMYGSLANPAAEKLLGKAPGVVNAFNKAKAPALLRGAAARAAPALMAKPGLGTMAAVGYGSYKGTEYLMDKSGAADALGKMIAGGNKNYNISPDQQSKNDALLEKGFNPFEPMKDRRGNIKGYERTPGYNQFIGQGGTPEGYANRNADMQQPLMQEQAPQVMPQAAPAAETPNVGAVQEAPAVQPNLEAVQGMPAADPQAPKMGDLVGSYQDAQGRNVGIFEGMPLRDENTGELTYITNDQLSALEGSMDKAGMPVISGEKGAGLKPAIDPATGDVFFADPDQANRMNAAEGQQRDADRQAQLKAINNLIESGESSRRIRAAQQAGPEERFVSYYDQDSKKRQEKAMQPSTFNDAKRSSSSSKDGLTDAQRARIYGRGTPEAEASKAGINPGTGNTYANEQAERERKAAESEARIAEMKEGNPSVFEEASETVDGIMGLPQYKDLTPEQKSQIRNNLLMSLLGIKENEQENILDITDPLPPPPPDGTETDTETA